LDDDVEDDLESVMPETTEDPASATKVQLVRTLDESKMILARTDEVNEVAP
jgi:hypothetical protein